METFIQVSVTEAIMMRSLLAVCILAMVAPAAAFSPGCVPTLRSARAPAITMQKKVDILGKGEQSNPDPAFSFTSGRRQSANRRGSAHTVLFPSMCARPGGTFAAASF